MACRVNESDVEHPPAKKVMTPEEEFDSSEEEEDHSFYFENRESQPYWYCHECKTCITRPCFVDANNQHFQMKKDTGEYYATSVTMFDKPFKLIINRNNENDNEIFMYVSALPWGHSN